MIKTLKFRIALLCVAASLLTALGVTASVLSVTQAKLQLQLLDSDRNDRMRTAQLMASKLETLKGALTVMARSTDPQLWHDPEAMNQYLLARPVISALFNGVLAADPDGTLLARTEDGKSAMGQANLADRPYFQQALRGDQPVVSDPLWGKVNKKAMVVIAVAVRGAEGEPVGVLAGLLHLHSDSLFASPGTTGTDGVRELLMNRSGQILWHTDAQRLMGSAADEPGLAAFFARWHGTGSPIDTVGSAELSQGHLVSMAGLPLSDWALVRVVPEGTAMATLQAAQRTALATALAAGLISALVAGLVAMHVVRPIGLLRDQAERLLAGNEPLLDGWPRNDDEIGALSKAFQALLLTRHQQHAELQAVLDNADVGLTLTRNGRFEMVSRQFCRIFGLAPDEVVGQATRMIHASDAHYAAFSARAQPAFMQHGLFDGEVELVKRDGQTFRARMRGRAVAPGDRTKGTIWVIADETQSYEQRERLSWAASHDRLTGLPNRSAFETLLEEATASAQQAPFCALFIDLDRFKQVNDLGGHAAGDALLRDLARELSGKLRKSDTVARLGGDEFAVLLPHCPIPRAQVLAESLRAAVEAYRLQWEGTVYSVGASIGLVPVNGTHASAADVLRAADAACYAAKRSGRNQVAVAA
jgi:diguanylate cyclase (GGDEF)-like protein/PAS domain S-box-containing protein